MHRTNTVLFALTSHDKLGDTGGTTGFYVPEAAHLWRVFATAGYRVDVVSPLGGQPPRDGTDPSDPVQRAFLDDPGVAAQLRNTARPEEVDPARYDAICYVGGHGAMWDFPGNEALARIAGAIYESGGVVGAVCHGPAGLLDIRRRDGSPLVHGRAVAAFTNSEESAVGKTEVVPFLLETALADLGAKHTGVADFEPHVVVDERLVTGQNPASATGVARAVVEILTDSLAR